MPKNTYSLEVLMANLLTTDPESEQERLWKRYRRNGIWCMIKEMRTKPSTLSQAYDPLMCAGKHHLSLNVWCYGDAISLAWLQKCFSGWMSSHGVLSFPPLPSCCRSKCPWNTALGDFLSPRNRASGGTWGCSRRERKRVVFFVWKSFHPQKHSSGSKLLKPAFLLQLFWNP